MFRERTHSAPTREQVDAALARPIVGNHFSDSRMLNTLGDAVLCTALPMRVRIAALRKMDATMGMEQDVYTPASVHAAVEQMQ